MIKTTKLTPADYTLTDGDYILTIPGLGQTLYATFRPGTRIVDGVKVEEYRSDDDSFRVWLGEDNLVEID